MGGGGGGGAFSNIVVVFFATRLAEFSQLGLRRCRVYRGFRV